MVKIQGFFYLRINLLCVRCERNMFSQENMTTSVQELSRSIFTKEFMNDTVFSICYCQFLSIKAYAWIRKLTYFDL